MYFIFCFGFSKAHRLAFTPLQEAYSLDRTKKSEIAFIFDDESILAISNGSSYTLVETLRNHVIARIGAPVDQYYHDDMANPDMPSYKMYVFVNTLVLTEEERKVIKDKLKKKAVVLFILYFILCFLFII